MWEKGKAAVKAALISLVISTDSAQPASSVMHAVVAQ